MKYALVLLSVLTSTAVLAYQSPQFKFVIENPLKEGLLVERTPGLKMSRLEHMTKSSLAKLKIQNPAKFNELKSKRLENSELYQSWIDEVDEALAGKNIKVNPKAKIDYYEKFVEGTPIDISKKIAKRQMLNLILRNWGELKETAFNEVGVESKDQARLYGIELINKGFVYIPRANSRTNLFMLGDNFVEIEKRYLKTGRSGLDIDSRYDNSLDPAALKIVADDEGKKKSPTVSKNSSSETTTTPTPPAPAPSPSLTDTLETY